METTDDLLKQILAAQLAQIALLQSIAVSTGVHVAQEYGKESTGTTDLNAAVKLFEAASFQLALREAKQVGQPPQVTGDRGADTLPEAFPD